MLQPKPTPGKRGTQDFDQKADGKPFHAARRGHRPGQPCLGVGGWGARGVQSPAQGNGLPLICGAFDGGPCHGRGRLIDQKRNLALWCGDGIGKGVGANDRAMPAHRRNRRHRIRGPNRQKTRPRQSAGVKPKRRGIVRVENPHRRNPLGFGGWDQLGKARLNRRMGKAVARIDAETAR